MVLAKNFHKQKSGKVNNYWRIISPNCRQRRKLYFGSASTLFEDEGRYDRLSQKAAQNSMLNQRARLFNHQLLLLVKLAVKEIYFSTYS